MAGPPDALDRLAQWLVILAALFAAANGTAMLVVPLQWYDMLPSVIATGPPNVHFLRDIALAYLASAVILAFGSINLRMRWLAALAGNLWLTVHGLLHIYEVTTGICTPQNFWADAPGVLGPPLFVFIAIGILMVRERVAPYGIPKALLMHAVAAKSEESEVEYLAQIAKAPGAALERFKHFMPASAHRHVAPANLFHAASMGAVFAEDCGPCALTAAHWAQVDGVPDEAINHWLSRSGDVPVDEQLAMDFGHAIATQGDDAFELGDRIEREFGHDVRLELAMGAATVRTYPAMKRGLGLTKACSLTPLQV